VFRCCHQNSYLNFQNGEPNWSEYRRYALLYFLLPSDDPQPSSNEEMTNLLQSDSEESLVEVEDQTPLPTYKDRLKEIFFTFGPLGWAGILRFSSRYANFPAFGGPQAHIALLMELFIEKKKWVDANRFSELLGLGQGIPGPTSTQVHHILKIFSIFRLFFHLESFVAEFSEAY
jgi:hypothetical protein